MRKLILVFAVLSFTGSAFATDLPLLVKAPLSPVIPGWAGFYAGVQVGALWNQDRSSETTTFVPPLTGSATTYGTGVIGGGHAGYNWQRGQVVFGPEVDFEGTSLRTTQNCLVQDFGAGNGAPGTCFPNNAILGYGVTSQIPWEASIRARLGYAWGNYLLYATGGVAFAEFRNTYIQTLLGVGSAQTFNDTKAGGTVGAGLEYKFNGRWIGRVEYRWTEFSGIVDAASTAGIFWNGYTERHTAQQNTVRVGLSYLLNGPIFAPIFAPIVAK